VSSNILLRRVSLILGLAVGLLLLVLALNSVDPAALLAALRATNPWFVLLALISVAATIGAKAVRWRLLFHPHEKDLRQSALVSALLIGQTINLLLPARLGELARAYLLGQNEGREKMLALGTIMVEKLLDGLALLLVLGVLFLVLPLENWLRISGALAALVTAVLLAAVLLLGKQRERMIGASATVARRVPWLGRLHLAEHLDSLAGGVDSLLARGVRVRLMAWTAAVWLLGATTNLLILVGMEIRVPALLASLLVLVVVHLGLVVPSSPARIGVFHYLCLLSLTMLGVEQGQALAYGFVLHGVVVVPVLLAGLAFLWRENLTLYRLVSEAQK